MDSQLATTLVEQSPDAMIFAGMDVKEYCGPSPAAHRVRQLVDEMLQAQKWVAALCTGQIVLAKNGYLQGKKAAYNDKANFVESRSVDWVNEPVVVDGRFITGAHPDNAQSFGDEVARRVRRGRD